MKLNTLVSRYRTLIIVLVTWLSLNTVAASQVIASSAPKVRVLLLVQQVSVRIGGSMEIRDPRSSVPFTGEKVYTRTNLKTPLTITAQSGFLAVNGKPYRGELIVKPTPGGLMVINLVNLEEYLYGVLPGEVDPKWPKDALKAQAVAARSYALAQVRWRISEDFDLYDDVRSQVYYGVRKETPSTTEAVDATRGQVARYEGEVIQANFFASGGGQTANSEDVWGASLPYLRSVSDYDQASPHFAWKTDLMVEEIQTKMESSGICIGNLVNITPLARDNSGRIRSIQIAGEEGEVVLTGSAFRSILGLKSTNFTIVHSNSFPDDGRAGREQNSNADNHAEDGAQTMLLPGASVSSDVDGTISNDLQAPTQIGDLLGGATTVEPSPLPDLGENLYSAETQPIGFLPINLVYEQSEETGEPCETGVQDTASSFLSGLISHIFEFYSTKPGPLTGRVEIFGTGWGHGVGLSQWGAKEMAANGATYQQILTHYYKGIEIFQLYD